MDKKLTFVGIGGAVVMAVVILLAQRFTNSTADTYEAGQEAKLRLIIGAVIDEKQELDDGSTYGAALSRLVVDVAVIKEQVSALSEE